MNNSGLHSIKISTSYCTEWIFKYCNLLNGEIFKLYLFNRRENMKVPTVLVSALPTTSVQIRNKHFLWGFDVLTVVEMSMLVFCVATRVDF
jgi:hypothetical protein